MKIISYLAILVCFNFGVFAQNQGPIPKISKQTNDFSGYYQDEKIFIATDKQYYKPGETIWFSAFVTNAKTQLPAKDIQELTVRIYDKSGGPVVHQLLQPENGFASGNIDIPEDQTAGRYFLTANTSAQIGAQNAFVTVLNIVQDYGNQLVAKVKAKDSISMAGQQNELNIQLGNLAGAKLKNTSIQYQLMNGKEIIEQGKLNTDATGNAVLRFTLPEKSNGEPFTCELSDKVNEWKQMVFLPSDIDPVIVGFNPEGGTIAPGVPVKIGFTAFNRWGIPVDIEGSVIDQENNPVAIVRTLTAGLGLFSLVNDGKQQFRLVLTGKTGKNQTFDLPAPNQNGFSFSVAKSDPDFISVNLIFSDKQKHKVALAATHGYSLNWAADLEIDGVQRIKIPTEELPQGINQLSVFDTSGKLLAERLVFVDKNQQLKITVEPEKNSIRQGENMKIKIRLTDEKNQAIKGAVSISVADQFWKSKTTGQIRDSYLTGTGLQKPFSLFSYVFKGQAANSAMMDIFLIANRQVDFDWQKIMEFRPETAANENRNNDLTGTKFEARLSDLLSAMGTKNSLISDDRFTGTNYFANNEDLFTKTHRKAGANNPAINTQQRLLSNSTNLLDVIKSLKPYRIMNNQIVFYGSENSLNYQGGALIILDGQQIGTDISIIQSISPTQVDRINVSTNAMDIQRYTGLNSVGIIEIFQKSANKNMPVARDEPAKKNNIQFGDTKEFQARPSNVRRDMRTTLQWVPSLLTDENGQAEITITAGKVLSNFIIEVQATDVNGRMGTGKGSFSVEK